MGRVLLSIALLAGLSGVAFGQTAPASEIAPGGKLRVGVIAITVLGGVAEPVARFIGQKLGAAVEPVMYPDPGAYLQSFGRAECRISPSGRASFGQELAGTVHLNETLGAPSARTAINGGAVRSINTGHCGIARSARRFGA